MAGELRGEPFGMPASITTLQPMYGRIGAYRARHFMARSQCGHAE
jgi:hypothetical protein